MFGIFDEARRRYNEGHAPPGAALAKTREDVIQDLHALEGVSKACHSLAARGLCDQLPLDGSGHRQDLRRRIKPALLAREIQALHDQFGLLFGECDFLTHCPASPVQRPAMR